MRKILSILLVFQILGNSLFAGEYAKIPFLMIHYQHHTSETGDIEGFLDFVLEHYGDSAHSTQGDDDCHGQMPFKHCHDGHSAKNGGLVPFTLIHSEAVALPTWGFHPLPEPRASLLTGASCLIWQPPD